MRCPHCRQLISEDVAHCPECGHAISHTSEVLEPEILDESGRPLLTGKSTNDSAEHGQYVRFTRVFQTSFPGGNRDGLPPSCLPTIIMLALALGAAVQYGLLAAIGFLVFAGIGRVIAFVLTLRHVLEGRRVNPWIFHIITWVICWVLVAWLSGGMD